MTKLGEVRIAGGGDEESPTGSIKVAICVRGSPLVKERYGKLASKQCPLQCHNDECLWFDLGWYLLWKEKSV